MKNKIYGDGFDIAWDDGPKKKTKRNHFSKLRDNMSDKAQAEAKAKAEDAMREMFGNEADYLDDDIGDK